MQSKEIPRLYCNNLHFNCRSLSFFSVPDGLSPFAHASPTRPEIGGVVLFYYCYYHGNIRWTATPHTHNEPQKHTAPRGIRCDYITNKYHRGEGSKWDSAQNDEQDPIREIFLLKVLIFRVFFQTKGENGCNERVKPNVVSL